MPIEETNDSLRFIRALGALDKHKNFHQYYSIFLVLNYFKNFVIHGILKIYNLNFT